MAQYECPPTTLDQLQGFGGHAPIILKWNNGSSIGLLSQLDHTCSSCIRSKYVKLVDLATLMLDTFQANATQSYQVIDLIGTSGTFVATRPNTLIIAVVRPPLDLTYHSAKCGRISKIRLPWTVWGGKWVKQHFEQGYVMVSTSQPMSADAHVRPWPWANVYHDGHICWGSVTPSFEPSQLPAMIDSFMDSKFNTDLWQASAVCQQWLHGLTLPDELADVDRLDLSNYLSTAQPRPITQVLYGQY